MIIALSSLLASQVMILIFMSRIFEALAHATRTSKVCSALGASYQQDPPFLWE